METMTIGEIQAAAGGRITRGNASDTIAGICTDSRILQPGELFVAIKGENFDGHKFAVSAMEKGACGVLASSEVNSNGSFPDRSLLMVDDTLHALGELAKNYRHAMGVTVIGITGSNGKTTTKEMLHQILSQTTKATKSQKSYNNNVGVPLTIFQINQDHQYAVVEMGTSSLGEIARLGEIAQPEIGVITNISETHLEGLGNVEGVARAKAELLDCLPDDGLAVLSTDDQWSTKLQQQCSKRILTFGLSSEADFRATEISQDSRGISFVVNDECRIEIPMIGRYNVCNALASIAVARNLGVDFETIQVSFRDYHLPLMRMTREVIDDIVVINDAYNANPSSTIAALKEYERIPSKGRKVMVCGDMLELGDESERLHRKVGQSVASSKVDILWTVGKESRSLAESAQAWGMKPQNIHGSENSAEAAEALLSFIRPGDTVLLKGSRGMELEKIVQRMRATLCHG